MGLQLYTSSWGPGRELQKCHAENHEIIIDYINDLKECGYEIIHFPPIKKFRNYYICTIICEPPPIIE